MRARTSVRILALLAASGCGASGMTSGSPGPGGDGAPGVSIGTGGPGATPAMGGHYTCTPPTEWDPPTGPTATVMLSMTNGTSTVSCTFVTPDFGRGFSSCPELGFELDTAPTFHWRGGDRVIEYRVSVKGDSFHGPAIYDKADLNLEEIFFFDFLGAFGPWHYRAGDASTASLTVNADASGAFVFDEFHADKFGTQELSPPVSGNVIWGCHDPL